MLLIYYCDLVGHRSNCFDIFIVLVTSKVYKEHVEISEKIPQDCTQQNRNKSINNTFLRNKSIATIQYYMRQT